MKKKQFLTVEVLKLNVTDQGVELGAKGSLVAIATLLPMLAVGWFAGQQLSNYVKTPINLPILTTSVLVLLACWSTFLIWHVRKLKSMTRVLIWISVVGTIMGLLAFEARH